MSPHLRRITYAVSYEVLGMALSAAGLITFTGASVALAGTASAGTTLIALVWSVAFNWLFEAWEARQTIRGRSMRRRIAHTVFYEGGLTALMVPFLAWWMSISILEALIYDIGLLIFFFVYTFIFTWGFDRIFGLPASAR